MKVVKLDVIKATVSEIQEVGTSETSGIKGVNHSHKVTLDDGTTWILKLAKDEHTSHWRYIPPHSQYSRERAAYLIDEELEFDLVPFTKIVRYKSDVGSLQRWIENAQPADTSLQTYSLDNIWKMGLLDLIIANTDRHSNNWLTHANKPIAIDHGYAFPNKANREDPKSVILSRFACKIWNQRIPEKFISDMQRLKKSVIFSVLRALLGSTSADLIMKRLNYLLQGKAWFPNYRIIPKLERKKR